MLLHACRSTPPASARPERQSRPPRLLTTTPGSGGDDDLGSGDWKEQLIEALLATPPDRFERLARRLLREAGFISATVTGKSGDGGIDGIGVYRLSLVSFPVFFQCKRYKGSVGAGAVRDFRGAMSGRGDKGLLITTGSFTADAKQEATREGAPPVDLIDGDRLCDLLKEYDLGGRSDRSRMSPSFQSSSRISDRLGDSQRLLSESRHPGAARRHSCAGCRDRDE
jgi:restriction system protein